MFLQNANNNDGTISELFDGAAFAAFLPQVGGAAYPRLYELVGGTILLGFDHFRQGERNSIMVITSQDMQTWSEPVLIAQYDNLDVANVAFAQLPNGDILAAYRANDDVANEPRRANYYSSIRASVSRDNGESWQHHSIIVEETGMGGVYEPHFGFLERNGEKVLAVFYANDSWNVVNQNSQQNIEFRFLEDEAAATWSETFIASNGIQTQSRDGMPVWDRLPGGGYVMVIEATNEPGFPFVVQLTTSADGWDWSTPMRNIFVPQQQGKKAGAPYVVPLPDGRLAVSFQTDDGRQQTGDHNSRMNVIFSVDETWETWTEPIVPFNVPEGTSANWGSVFLWDGALYAASGTVIGGRQGIWLRRILVE